MKFRPIQRGSAVAFGILSLLVCSSAMAEQNNWRLRVGPGAIKFDESATLSAAGTPVPGGNVTMSDSTSLIFELGYEFAPGWSAALTAGLPPTTKVRGAGTAAPFGELGRAKYAPAGFALQYQFQGFGAFKPYVGAGAVYNMILSEKDGALANLRVRNSWGSVLQVGAEYELSPTKALFVDFKQMRLKTTATGNLTALGGAPAEARIRLNPSVLQVGMAFRF